MRTAMLTVLAVALIVIGLAWSVTQLRDGADDGPTHKPPPSVGTPSMTDSCALPPPSEGATEQVAGCRLPAE